MMCSKYNLHFDERPETAHLLEKCFGCKHRWRDSEHDSIVMDREDEA